MLGTSNYREVGAGRMPKRSGLSAALADCGVVLSRVSSAARDPLLRCGVSRDASDVLLGCRMF